MSLSPEVALINDGNDGNDRMHSASGDYPEELRDTADSTPTEPVKASLGVPKSPYREPGKPSSWNLFSARASKELDINTLLTDARADQTDNAKKALNQLSQNPKLAIKTILDNDLEQKDLVEHTTNMYACLTILADAVEGKQGKIGAAIASGAKALGSAGYSGAKALGSAGYSGLKAVGREGTDLVKVAAYTPLAIAGTVTSPIAKIVDANRHLASGNADALTAAAKSSVEDYDFAKKALNSTHKNFKLSDKGYISTAARTVKNFFDKNVFGIRQPVGGYTRRGRNKRRTFRARRA
jgi:hypothetical protein